jgi:outer membrane receptor protein involved in Fe transport
MTPSLPMQPHPDHPLLRAFSAALAVLALGASTAFLSAQSAPAPTSPAPDETVVLSPFRVESRGDEGYTATSALAGGRLSTPLRDTAAAISVLTEQFMQDIGATSFLDAAEWAPNAVSNYVTGPNIFQDYQINFRSLGGGFQSRNHFRWYSNSDVYNTERIEFARGPNSVIFGDAGVGGVANVNSKRARERPLTAIDARVHSWGGERVSIDINRPLTEHLYLRFAALYDRDDHWKDVQTTRRDGWFLTATWEPSPRTQVRAEYEYGRVDRTVNYPLLDFYSSWDGTTVVNAPLTTGNFGGGVARFTTDRLVFDPAHPGLGIQNWRNFGQTTGSDRQILDRPMVHAPNVSPVVPSLKYGFQANNVVAGHNYWTASAFFEQQISDRVFVEVAGNYMMQNRAVDFPLFFDALRIDVNAVLPTGAPNPNFGKHYAEGTIGTQVQQNDVIELRAIGVYLLDTAVTRQRLLVSGGFRSDTFELLDWYLVRTNGPNPNVADGQNRINVYRYADALHLPLTRPNPSDVSGIRTEFLPIGGMRRPRDITYFQAAASGYWLRDDRVSTVFGYRHDRVIEEPYALRRETGTNRVLGFGNKTRNVDYTVDTFTAGSVLHLTSQLSLLANYGESFTPTGTNFALDGSALPPRIARGIDLGIRFSLLEGRINGSLAYYWNEQRFNRIGGESGNINAIWQDLGRSDEVFNGYNDVTTFEGTGYELDLTANLTRNIRLMANFALPDTKQSAGFEQTKAYYNTHVGTWNQLLTQVQDPALAQQIRQRITNIENRIGGFAVGRRNDGTFDHTANFFANYSFHEGRLKGFSFGTGINHRGPRQFGNRPGNSFDYLKSESYYTLSGMANYQTSTPWGRLRLQLNIANLTDRETIMVTSMSNHTVNGVTQLVPRRYSVHDPRRVTFSTNFSF